MLSARGKGLPGSRPLIESSQIQKSTAVDLCVPTPVHAPLIRQALAAGKDFFCEKPLCETAAEARELNRLATERAQRVGMVGYVYRYAPVFQKARSILAGADETGTSPVIGTISVVADAYRRPRLGRSLEAPPRRGRRRHQRDAGAHARSGGVVFRPDRARRTDDAGSLPAAAGHRRQAWRMSTQRILSSPAFGRAAGVPVRDPGRSLTPSFTQMIEVQGDNGTLMASIQPEMPQFVFVLREAGGYPAGRTELSCGQVNFFDAQMAAFVAAVREGRPQLGEHAHRFGPCDEALEAFKA